MLINPLLKSFISFSKLPATSSLLQLRTLPRYSFSNNYGSNKVSQIDNTAGSIVAKNIGMNKFLNKTYMFTGLAFGGALSTAYFAAKSGLMTVSPIISMIFMFAGLIGASVMKPLPANETYNGHTIYKTQNSPLRLGLYGMGVAGLGLSASPLLAYAYMVSPNIIINALAAATGIFGGASYVAYSMPKDKMLGYGRILGGSLMGLIGIQLAGLLSTLVIGPNAFASLLFSVDSYFSIALFTGFVAYDTHVAIKSYQQGNADHLGLSIQFLLDLWNIFISLVRIFLQRGE